MHSDAAGKSATFAGRIVRSNARHVGERRSIGRMAWHLGNRVNSGFRGQADRSLRTTTAGDDAADTVNRALRLLVLRSTGLAFPGGCSGLRPARGIVR